MEEELFVASAKDKVVKALGIVVNCNLVDLHVYVNGVDLSKTAILEELKVTVEKKSA